MMRTQEPTNWFVDLSEIDWKNDGKKPKKIIAETTFSCPDCQDIWDHHYDKKERKCYCKDGHWVKKDRTWVWVEKE